MPTFGQKRALFRILGLTAPFFLGCNMSLAENKPDISDWKGGYFGPVFALTSIKQKYADRLYEIEKIRGTGKLAGAIAGYNTTYDDKVIGIEADVINRTVFKHSPYLLATMRARFGIKTDGPLLYLTSGIALSKLDRKRGGTMAGIAAGAGLEQFVTKGISARLEYMHSYTPLSISLKKSHAYLQDTNQIRAAIIIHFNEK